MDLCLDGLEADISFQYMNKCIPVSGFSYSVHSFMFSTFLRVASHWILPHSACVSELPGSRTLFDVILPKIFNAAWRGISFNNALHTYRDRQVSVSVTASLLSNQLTTGHWGITERQGCPHFFSMRAIHKMIDPLQTCKTYIYFQIYILNIF